MRTYLLWLWFGLVLALQGCMHAAVQPIPTQVKASELKQRYYQAKTIAPDGTVLAFTVYQPHLKIGQTALVIAYAWFWLVPYETP